METPDILALDFDGVLCNGLVEYFQTAWQAYGQVWEVETTLPPEGMAEVFYRLRPVIETGWEMPVLIRAIVEGVAESEILSQWRVICDRIVNRDRLTSAALMAKVDGNRDRWINRDLAGWLACHQFYPGVANQVRSLLESSMTLVIITTKEARFVQELLRQEQIDIDSDRIIGKGVKRPKTETLLTFNPSQKRIWFIEDRFKTLQSVVQHTELDSVQLFLATWGYNTPAEQEKAIADRRIHCLSLETFAQPLPHWL